MLTVRLSLKGIYSYRNKAEIEFEPLTRAGLFGIFGPVGSGKSTIIEAMLLALYGDSPRLSQKERGANMMNLASDELRIEFEFRVREHRYLFTVEAKRNKKSGEPGSFKYGRYVWENGEWKPREIDAKSVTGLDQKHFLRTIVIPQGKFREFIDLGGKERAEMMKELFGLERFDLAEALKNLTVENAKTLERLYGSLSEYVGVSEEKIAETQTALDEAQETQNTAKQRLDELQYRVQSLTELGEKHRR
ncbi:MAG: SMC family ATPase, partial [Bacteroidia bacterium]|nr:SMC family ATPase [Bacteroidia bacterium]MDW8333404.1 SMC family ATPase [Bacteroidia bacterium]